MREFTSTDSFEIANRGVAYTTVADQEMDRATPDIVGELVLLDGDIVKVLGVERHLTSGPIYKGENIALLV